MGLIVGFFSNSVELRLVC